MSPTATSRTATSPTAPSSTTVSPTTGPRRGSTTTGAPPGASTSVLLRVPAGGAVLAIGDSVMLAGADDLEAAFGPSVTVDAAVGRQVDDGLDRLARYRSAGRLAGLRALVVGLGSNGPFEPGQLQRLVALTRGVREVVLVNVRVPRSWQSESDTTIDGAAGRPGFAVVDWYAASAAPGLLYPDAIHPDPAGQLVYANLVSEAVTGHGPSPRRSDEPRVSSGATR